MLIVIAVGFVTIVSCQQKPYFKEVVSEKSVTITMREVEGQKKYILNIPIEFELNLNQTDIKDVGIYYNKDSKRVQELFEYLVYNGDTNKVLFAIEDLGYGSYPNSIYVVDGLHELTDIQAKELLEKYAVKKSLLELKNKRDTIEVISYKKFRADHPDFINKMREKPDTLKLSIGFSKGREEVFAEQIKW